MTHSANRKYALLQQPVHLKGQGHQTLLMPPRIYHLEDTINYVT